MARGDNIIHDYCLLKISELCLRRSMSVVKMQHDNSIRVSQVCLGRGGSTPAAMQSPYIC